MLMKNSGVGAGDETGDSGHAGVLLPTGTTRSDDRGIELCQHEISVVMSCNEEGSLPDAAPTSGKVSDRYRRLRVLVLCTNVFITLSQVAAVDQIVKTRNLQGLTEFGGFERVAAVFRSNLKKGRPCASLRYSNTTHIKEFLKCLGKACKNHTVFLLLISGVLSLATEMLEEGPQRGWVDGVTILVAVILIVTVPAVTEFIRARNMKKKTLMEEKKVKVTRSGERQDIAVSGIVEGDVVILKNGDQIPADGLLYSGDGLILDEVGLHSIVNRDQNPFLFSGRKVVEGEGLMIVTSVGTNTALGKAMSKVTDDPSHLQSHIERPNNYAEKIALLLSILIIVMQFVRFLLGNHIHSDDGSQLPQLKGKFEVERLVKMIWRILARPQGLVCFFTTILTAVLLCFQHGSSVAITLAFSYWNSEVESDHASPRNPFACGTMGFTSVICIDASGGLMCNQVEIGKFFIGEKEIISEEGLNSKQDVYETLQQQIDIMPTAVPENPCFPMDHLIYSQVLSEWGVADQSVKEKFGIPRNSCGGSAETMLKMCTHYYDCRGKVHGLENETCKFVELIKNMEGSNLHPVAFAHKQSDAKETRGLTLVALVGFKLLAKTKLDMKELQRAGVRIILVTGNEQTKAESLAKDLGICRPGYVAPACELRRLNSRDRQEKMKLITVICSASSEDKLLMIQWLKRLENVVAFYGGFTTGDTPALKESDVAITLKTQSTEMARENSDIVITSNGDFSTLNLLVNRGRCIYRNIQKFVELQLTACIAGTLMTTLSTISWGDSAITPIQFFWASIIICFLGGMVMITSPPIQELMPSPLQAARSRSIMTREMWRNVAVQVIYQVSVLLIFQFKGKEIRGLNQKLVDTMIFNTFFLCQVFNLFNTMELEKKEIFQAALRAYWFWASVGVFLAMQVVLVQLWSSLADYGRLNGLQWAICLLLAGLSWVLTPVMKFVLPFFGSGLSWVLKQAMKFLLPFFVFILPFFDSIQSVSSYRVFSIQTSVAYLPYMGFVFSMFLLFAAVSRYFEPAIAMTLR